LKQCLLVQYIKIASKDNIGHDLGGNYLTNCNDCKLINITEKQQIDKGLDHICLKHNVRVIHRSNNPKIEHYYIYPCEQCNGNDFISRIDETFIRGKRSKLPLYYDDFEFNQEELNEVIKTYLNEDIIIKPKVENGKVLLDRNNPDHRYIMEDEC